MPAQPGTTPVHPDMRGPVAGRGPGQTGRDLARREAVPKGPECLGLIRR
jgi:hypothetical protein